MIHLRPLKLLINSFMIHLKPIKLLSNLFMTILSSFLKLKQSIYDPHHFIQVNIWVLYPFCHLQTRDTDLKFLVILAPFKGSQSHPYKHRNPSIYPQPHIELNLGTLKSLNALLRPQLSCNQIPRDGGLWIFIKRFNQQKIKWARI